jgi:hypothetical protein
MAYRDAVVATLNMVQWDLEKGESINMVRALHASRVLIRDAETHWLIIYRTNPAYRREVLKGVKG